MLLEHQWAAFATNAETPMFENFLWNTLRGHWLRYAPGEPSFLGHHFSPILLLMVPLYAPLQSIHTLLFLQALAAAAAIYPLWRLAHRQLESPGAALAIAACIPLSRVMNYGVMFGFHMEVLYPVLAFAAFYFYEARRWIAYALVAVLFLLVKEDAAVPLAGLGLYMMARGQRTAGFITAVGSLLWLVLSLLVFIPAFRTGMEDQSWEFTRYWSEYGDDLTAIAMNMLDPRRHFEVLFTPEKLEKSFNVFSVFLFLPFFSWKALLFLVFPSWFILFSSNNGLVYGLANYYGFAITPFLFYAAIEGLRILKSRFPSRPHLVAALIGLMLCVNLGNARLWKHIQSSYWRVPPRVQTAKEMIATLPEGAVVTAQFPLLAHLPPSTGRFLIWGREPIDAAEWVMFDLAGSSYPLSQEENDELYEELLASGLWGVEREADGYALLRRSE
jgi:uncharacterized membrane protein